MVASELQAVSSKESGIMARKYKNQPTLIDGILFDSRRESERYLELKSMEQRGEIFHLRLQPVFTLLSDFTGRDGKTIRGVVYRADFAYQDKNKVQIVEDVKGVKTKDFVIKWKFVQVQNPLIVFRLVK